MASNTTEEIVATEEVVPFVNGVQNKKKKGMKYHTPEERLMIAREVALLTDLAFKGGKLKRNMTFLEACDKVGITFDTFSYWREADPYIDALFKTQKKNRLEQMRHAATSQVEKALYGQLRLKDKEKVDIALRFLEKVDEEWKDKKEIKIEGINLSSSIEDLEAKARVLLKDLTTDNNTTNE